MFVLALPCIMQVGISCIENGRKLVATSIVVFGGYEEDVDCGEILHYSIICIILIPAKNHDASRDKLPTLFIIGNTSLHSPM